MPAISQTDLENAYADAQTIAAVANSTSPTTVSRLGTTLNTLSGLLAQIGYLPPVAYASGLTVSTTLYTVTSGGLIYAPLPNLVPFTTAGAFNPAQWFLLQIAPSTFIKTLLDDVDDTTARATLNAAKSGANTDLTSVYLNNGGLKVKDTNASHGLIFTPGSDLTADRVLTITTGDNARTLNISAANVTISSFVATLLDDAAASNFLTTLGVSSFIQTLLDDAAAVNARSTLGIRETDQLDIMRDETTTITTGTNKYKYRVRDARTLVGVRSSLATASSSGLPTVDINKNGTTVLSTKLTIDATELTSATAATPAVISVSSFAAGDEVEIDIDVAGTGAKGLKVYLDWAY